MKKWIVLLAVLTLLGGCGKKEEAAKLPEHTDAQTSLSAVIEQPAPSKPATVIEVQTQGVEPSVPQEPQEVPAEEPAEVPETVEETEEAVPGLPDIDITSWEYILANAENDISTYAPNTYEVEGHLVDIRCADALAAFLQAARSEGLSAYLSSAYRDYDTQNYLYQRKVEQYGDPDIAATIVAPPGTSEHQTGLAFDITDQYYEFKDASLENTALFQWMSQHCHEYGFIVRYPYEKQDVTGIIYEPWHFRYVGVEAATYIMENGLCLEEFLELYK